MVQPVRLCGSERAFAAIRSDDTVVAWGAEGASGCRRRPCEAGAPTAAPAAACSWTSWPCRARSVRSQRYAATARWSAGATRTTAGDLRGVPGSAGGDGQRLSDVEQLQATGSAFAALRSAPRAVAGGRRAARMARWPRGATRRPGATAERCSSSCGMSWRSRPRAGHSRPYGEIAARSHRRISSKFSKKTSIKSLNSVGCQ